MTNLQKISKILRNLESHKLALQGGLRYTDMLIHEAKMSNMKKYGNFYTTKHIDLWRRLSRKDSILAEKIENANKDFEHELDLYLGV